jgi:addiction module HigA family antidote
MTPKNRPPTTPGEMLVEEFMKPLGLTQVALAAKMGIPIQRLNTIIKGHRGVTADTALRLSKALKTSAEFWLHLQMGTDLWEARLRAKAS